MAKESVLTDGRENSTALRTTLFASIEAVRANPALVPVARVVVQKAREIRLGYVEQKKTFIETNKPYSKAVLDFAE